ncbi:unnamed protein product, partial [Prunus brigantina]
SFHFIFSSKLSTVSSCFKIHQFLYYIYFFFQYEEGLNWQQGRLKLREDTCPAILISQI